MDDIICTLENTQDINVNVEETEDVQTSTDNTIVLVDTDHTKLTNKDANDQHPISAITGLQSALNSKADTSNTYTKTEVDSALSGKQDTLVSGSNIKTINGESVLGSGDIEISSGGADYTELDNKPQVNGVELNGNKDTTQLKIGVNEFVGYILDSSRDFPYYVTKDTAYVLNQYGDTRPAGFYKYENGSWVKDFDKTGTVYKGMIISNSAEFYVCISYNPGGNHGFQKITDRNKQDVIDDLSIIRSNASEGKDAYDTIATYGNIVTHNTSEFATASQGTKADSALQPTDVINNTTSTATDKPLSANIGKELQDQITNLKSRGRYLSIWNCTTGLAETEPTVNPYEYRAGDYFIVGIVGTTNYRPNGAEYDKDVPSTTVETGDVKVNDTYYYDGTTWTLLDIGQVATTFSSLGGSPYDNSDLASALNSKIEDVKVNGTSVVTDKVANVTVPTKTSDLTNDSNYVTTTSYATSSVGGVVRTTSTYNVDITSSGQMRTNAKTYAQYQSLHDNAFIGKGTLENVITGKQLQTASDVATAISGKENTSNKVTSISSSSTDTQYPSAKAVYDQLDTKQDKFSTFTEIDGTEINVEELETGAYICKEDCTLLNNLGASIQVEAGSIFVKNDGGIGLMYGYGLCWGDFSLSDWNDIHAPTFIDLYDMPLARDYTELNTINKRIINAINELQSTKQINLISGMNIKTINNQSLLGNGNINISGGGGNVDDVKVNGTSVVDANKVANITVPTKTSDLTNDSNFQTGSEVNSVISTHNTSSSAHSTLFSAKQDTLVSGTNIKTINGESILGSGNIAVGGSVDIDNSTITTNSDDELQTVGVKDARTNNTLKTWTGTKAQYDAITTKDSNTFYNITDDSDVTLTLLQTIYPVGSIYITTNATCPLSALFGTWQLVGADRVLQGAGTRGSVGTTVNESLPNIKGSIEGYGDRTGFGPNGTNGVFYSKTTQSKIPSTGQDVSGYNSILVAGFDASHSSSIYQDNAPVQQDAYLVNIFRRIS